MATIYVSEAEAARDLPELLARVRAGVEVVIEDGKRPAVVLHAPGSRAGRLISESISLAEAHAAELGFEPVMDAEFASDLEEIVRNRKPRDRSVWD